MNKELSEFKNKMREVVANFMSTKGCSCCQSKEHPENEEALGKLLNVKKYSDGSGYNFTKYKTKK